MEARVESKLSRRERKKHETHQGLLEAAWSLFREKGYRATTVEEITERADVAKGTFFNYFDSKEALLDELSVWGIEQLRAALDVSKGAPASPVARIKLLMRHMHGQVAQDIKLFRRAFASHLRHPPQPPHRAKRELFGFLTDLAREAQACGEIRADVDAELVSDLLHVAYFRRMEICSEDGTATLCVDDFEQTVDLLMEGLAGPALGTSVRGRHSLDAPSLSLPSLSLSGPRESCPTPPGWRKA
jgi:AcrR family transcriptional regulator